MSTRSKKISNNLIIARTMAEATTPPNPGTTLPLHADIDKSVMLAGQNLQNFRYEGGEDFLVPAAVGTAGDKYPMMKGYDFSEDTSKNGGRPAGQRGNYRSSKTFSVTNDPNDTTSKGVARCHMYFDQTDQKYYIGALTSSFTKNRTWGQKYGLWMVRWKRGAYNLGGYKVAYLLWPALVSGDTASDGRYIYNPWDWGEIDCPENLWQAYIHFAGGAQNDHNRGNAASYQPSNNPWDPQTWHTMSLMWTPGQVQIFIDNTRILNHTGEGVPTEPMFVAYQNETNLGATPPPQDAFYDSEVDFLKQYSYEPGLGVPA